jgi:hypothetical protein
MSRWTISVRICCFIVALLVPNFRDSYMSQDVQPAVRDGMLYTGHLLACSQ